MSLFTNNQLRVLGFHCSHYKTDKLNGEIRSSSYRYVSGKNNEFVIQVFKGSNEQKYIVGYWKHGTKQWERNVTEVEEIVTLLIASEYEKAVGAMRKFALDEILADM